MKYIFSPHFKIYSNIQISVRIKFNNSEFLFTLLNGFLVILAMLHDTHFSNSLSSLGNNPKLLIFFIYLELTWHKRACKILTQETICSSNWNSFHFNIEFEHYIICIAFSYKHTILLKPSLVRRKQGTNYIYILISRVFKTTLRL